MTTNRVPIGRPPVSRITENAIAAFRKMQTLELQCTCPPIAVYEKYFEHEECTACEQWWQQHSTLVAELRLKPWEWPAVENPEAASSYPEGSEARKNDKPDLEAQARYRALAQAVAEDDKRKRALSRSKRPA